MSLLLINALEFDCHIFFLFLLDFLDLVRVGEEAALGLCNLFQMFCTAGDGGAVFEQAVRLNYEFPFAAEHLADAGEHLPGPGAGLGGL